jgi:hypothetical protein
MFFENEHWQVLLCLCKIIYDWHNILTTYFNQKLFLVYKYYIKLYFISFYPIFILWLIILIGYISYYMLIITFILMYNKSMF